MTKNQAYINHLSALLREKEARSGALTRIIDSHRKNYKNLSPLKLNIAISEVCNMTREQESIRKWVVNAKKEISSFYAPASL